MYAYIFDIFAAIYPTELASDDYKTGKLIS